MLISIATLALALPILPPQEAEPAAPAAAKADENRDRAILGPPLVVNGVRVPDNEIKLYLIWGPGRQLADTLKLQAVIDAEIKLMADAGEDVSKFEVTDEELDGRIEKRLEQFDHNYPTLERDAEIRRAHGTEDWFRAQTKQTLQFDRVFFPPNPDDWPVITIEAIRNDAGDFWIEDAKRSYERRKEIHDAQGGEWPEEDDTYMKFVRDVVVRALLPLHDIQTPADGLPSDLALKVNDRVWTTEELFQRILPVVTPYDVYMAKRWLAVVEAGKQALAQAMVPVEDNMRPALLTDEEYQAAWNDLLDQLAGSTFSLEAAAITGQSFPSVLAYAQYFLLHESFRRLAEKHIADSTAVPGELPEVLKAQLQRTNKNLGIGKVDADIMLISAFDWANNKWKENGWEQAEKTAEALKQKIDEHQRAWAEYRREVLKKQAQGEEAPETELDPPDVFWAKMVEDHSEFWDPPPPVHGHQSMVGYKMKGRFGERTRNDLARLMGEYFFYDLCFGNSVTDYVFFEQIPNTYAGPMIGPHGYYISYLRRRQPPTRPLDLSNEKHYELLVQDYIRETLNNYLKNAFDGADVKGLERP